MGVPGEILVCSGSVLPMLPVLFNSARRGGVLGEERDFSEFIELKKKGSTGSTLPEHKRISPGTPMTRTNANGVSTMVPYFSSLGSYLNGSI